MELEIDWRIGFRGEKRRNEDSNKVTCFPGILSSWRVPRECLLVFGADYLCFQDLNLLKQKFSMENNSVIISGNNING